MPSVPLMPGAEPFSCDGGPVGVLLVHGLTGSPRSMRPWGQALADAGCTVDAPRLPGHGTTWRELGLTRWPDWYGEAERAFLDLRERCDAVVVAGLSVGGCLALRLAEDHGSAVAGVALVNPSVLPLDWRFTWLLPVLRFVVPSLPGVVNDIKKPGQDEVGYDRGPLQATHSLVQLWAATRARLPEITQPLLVMHSAVDHVVPTVSTRTILAEVSSTDVTAVELPDSYHVATLDHDAPTIFASTVEFVQRVTAGVAR